jgi:hypothetical protein
MPVTPATYELKIEESWFKDSLFQKLLRLSQKQVGRGG